MSYEHTLITRAELRRIRQASWAAFDAIEWDPPSPAMIRFERAWRNAARHWRRTQLRAWRRARGMRT